MKKKTQKMKLFIVSTDEWSYDQYDSHVIAAHTPEEAMSFAALPGPMDKFFVQEIGISNEKHPCTVHSSYNAG